MLPENNTGFPTEEDKIEQDLKKAHEDITIGNYLYTMTETRGWKILTEDLANKTATLLEQLVVEKNPDTIRQIQSLILALRFLPSVVENLFLDAERAKDVLSSFQDYIGQAPEMG